MNKKDISRLAKKIRREQGIKHTEALEIVVKALGFRDYRQYLNTVERPSE